MAVARLRNVYTPERVSRVQIPPTPSKRKNLKIYKVESPGKCVSVQTKKQTANYPSGGKKAQRVAKVPGVCIQLYKGLTFPVLCSIISELATKHIASKPNAEPAWRSRVAGRARTIGNRVYPSRVQIPPSPPKKKSTSARMCFSFLVLGKGGFENVNPICQWHIGAQCVHWAYLNASNPSFSFRSNASRANGVPF